RRVNRSRPAPAGAAMASDDDFLSTAWGPIPRHPAVLRLTHLARDVYAFLHHEAQRPASRLLTHPVLDGAGWREVSVRDVDLVEQVRCSRRSIPNVRRQLLDAGLVRVVHLGDG